MRTAAFSGTIVYSADRKGTDMRVLLKQRIILLLGAALLLNGCAQAEEEDLPMTFPTTPTSPIASAMPAATPVPSVRADASMPLPEDTPGVEASAATASPAPAKESTPSPTPGNGRVTVAEGFYYSKLDDALKRRITGMSYPANDKNAGISYDDLRYIGLLYIDFSGTEKVGELIVHRKLAKEVTGIFYELYQAKYPLHSVRLVDDYGEPGDDNKSMADNNTSAFNYRRVTGSKTLSRHSYGAAIDINPVYNPYITGDRIAPENAAEYADRSRDFPGKIDHEDLCYRLFTKAGWSWGGDFKGDKDYQHFSKDIS